METDIFQQIAREIDEFKNQSISIVKGLEFNQLKTIERIYRYYNSTYEGGDIDSEGYKKYFFNIVRNPCYVATKAIDFDTKDIALLTTPGQNPIKTWLADRDLKFWMKEKNFGKILNRTFFELPIFGSVVLKIIGGDIYFVDLRYFYVEQSAESLKSASYVIELHYYTPDELRKIGKKLGWDNVEETIRAWRETKEPYICIVERYGEVPESWLKEDGDEQNYVYSRFICYLAEKEEKNKSFAGYILKKDKLDLETEFPYWEIHWEKIPGRWLGIGMVERLFDPQMRVNEEINLRVKSSYFASLNIFQTSDESINKNLLTDIPNGQIIVTRSGITRVPTEERNLSAFETEHRLWLQNRDELTMAFDVIRGERLPAGTPLGSAILASTMAASYFDQIRENIALEIKELLMKKIIPNFIKERSKEHYLKLVGEDLEQWNEWELLKELEVKKWEFVAKNGRLPSRFQYEMMKSLLREQKKKQKSKSIKIPKDYYKDLQYWLEIEITGEATDVRIKSANLQVALQAITVDPTLLIDPIKKKIFAKILEAGGISIADLEVGQETPSLTEVATQEVGKRAGGGVSAPSIPITPILGEGETKV